MLIQEEFENAVVLARSFTPTFSVAHWLELVGCIFLP